MAKMNDKLCSRCSKELSDIKESCLAAFGGSNGLKRICYARAELLAMDLDQLRQADDVDEITKASYEAMAKELEGISQSLSLGYAQQSSSGLARIWDKADEVLRLFAAWSFLAISSIIIALPCLLLLPLDQLLLRRGLIAPSKQLNVLSRRFIAFAMMKLSGVHVVTEGLQEDTFGDGCDMVCFSHASTMDAFLISAAVPVRALTPAKAELFLIPFFSWCLMAFGGIPIDRGDRGQAIRALEQATSAVSCGQCVSISPEGTRSKSGHITAFKKGAFYMWEALQCRIVPMVIYGAFDLYPPGRPISLPGTVVVRLLSPILPGEAKGREEMSALVRRRMLEAWKDAPAEAAAALSPQRLREHRLALALAYALFVAVAAGVRALLRQLSLSGRQGAGLFLGGSVAVTLVFYFYLMHISRWTGGKGKGK